jgi:hypothetical protein
MMNYKIFKNTMSIDNGKCQIYIGCDDTEVFNELHETVDRVLKKHYAFQEDKTCQDDDITYEEIMQLNDSKIEK